MKTTFAIEYEIDTDDDDANAASAATAIRRLFTEAARIGVVIGGLPEEEMSDAERELIATFVTATESALSYRLKNLPGRA